MQAPTGARSEANPPQAGPELVSVRPRFEHPFDVSFAEARALQERLRARVRERSLPEPLRRVAGVDVSYDRGSPLLYAAVVVLDAASGAPVECAGARMHSHFPYVPGFLSFREE